MGLTETQLQVLLILRQYGRADDEQLIAEARVRGLSASPSGLRTRRRELVDMKLVIDSGYKGINDGGRKMRQWAAV